MQFSSDAVKDAYAASPEFTVQKQKPINSGNF